MTDAELLDVAAQAAKAGADELRTRFRRQQGVRFGGNGVRFGSPDGVRTKSTPTDLVSDADVAAESAIRAVIGRRRPGDSILGEEGGTGGGSAAESSVGGSSADSMDSSDGGAELRWIVDPLDGTVNFLFGIPIFAVSVACEDASGTRAGIVLDPIREESFAASRSGPPTLNGEPLEGVPHASSLALAMVATGFAYDAASRARQARVVSRVLPRARDIRRAGSAALDLSWCACGRYDAYYERGLHAWDLAAGGLIAERAGLVVRELPAEAEDPAGVLVAPPELVDELFELVGN
jgi:myo-inositol-1(or 4)-monophosphatase